MNKKINENISSGPVEFIAPGKDTEVFRSDVNVLVYLPSIKFTIGSLLTSYYFYKDEKNKIQRTFKVVKEGFSAACLTLAFDEISKYLYIINNLISDLEWLKNNDNSILEILEMFIQVSDMASENEFSYYSMVLSSTVEKSKLTLFNEISLKLKFLYNIIVDTLELQNAKFDFQGYKNFDSKVYLKNKIEIINCKTIDLISDFSYSGKVNLYHYTNKKINLNEGFLNLTIYGYLGADQNFSIKLIITDLKGNEEYMNVIPIIFEAHNNRLDQTAG